MILRLLVGLGLMATIVQAQVINADIKVDATRLDDTRQHIAEALQRGIQYYIESYSWVNDAYDSPFNIQASFYLDTYSDNGYQQLYTGKVFWSNGTDQKYYDKLILFNYRSGEPLIHSTRFDPLTGLIDYWVNILLAGELDSYEQFGGAQLYTQARRIAEQGALSSMPKGWDDRLTDVEEITNNLNFRKMKYAYYDAMYAWGSKQDEEAFRQIKTFLDNLEAGLESEKGRLYAKQFLEAKYRELGDFYWEVGQREFLERLTSLDVDHTDYFQEMLKSW
ncbi:MAG: hypothetical protein AUJ47_00725 [Candidatus Marinimicrobia bacterium CG1_02_48_14]|nr:MAG: hypothetical protein AUJ47_00725 [Candidatus Marinimicrobia bacterium CG1_02_48_14]PJA54688.1 MAG: hypothetical protein CO167_02455 [Candidatus Marinimicrobia bacterium CG_4_9_14_3_um_filter_48_9]